jgi:hypothetical protein
MDAEEAGDVTGDERPDRDARPLASLSLRRRHGGMSAASRDKSARSTLGRVSTFTVKRVFSRLDPEPASAFEEERRGPSFRSWLAYGFAVRTM